MHRERQRALVEGLYGRVEALRAERDALRSELMRVQRAGVSVALPPPAVLPPLVPDCDLEAGVDPDGLDSASQLTAIIRSSKTLALPPKLTAPVAAPAQARGQLSGKATPSPKHTWHAAAAPQQSGTAPGSVHSASAASDPASGKGSGAKGRSTSGGTSSDEDGSCSVAGSERSERRISEEDASKVTVALDSGNVVIKTKSGQAITLDRSDVILASQYATRDALGEDTLEYALQESASEFFDSDDDICLADRESLASGVASSAAFARGTIGAASLVFADVRQEEDEGHELLGADVHSHAKAERSFDVDNSLNPLGASSPAAGAGGGGGGGGSSSSFFTSTLALCAMVAVLSGPTLLQTSGADSDMHELAASALEHLGEFAGSAGSMVQAALASPGTVPFLSGLGALLHSSVHEQQASNSQHEDLNVHQHVVAQEQAEPATPVPAVRVQPAAPAPSHIGAGRSLSTIKQSHADASSEDAEDKMSAHVLQLGAEQQAHVMAVMAMLKPVFAEEGSNFTQQQFSSNAGTRLRGHKQARPQRVAGVSIHDWMEFNNESGDVMPSGLGADHSVLTSLPLLHAPRVSNVQPSNPSHPAGSKNSKGLVPYAQQYPATALLPDSSGSISRLQLFRLGLMYGTLHGIEASNAGDWGQVVPSWSIVEASAVQQLAVLLASSEGQAQKGPSEAWRLLARASLHLRPQVDEALQGLSSVSRDSKEAAPGSGAGVLTDLMLGHAGGNATQELLQQAAAVLQR